MPHQYHVVPYPIDEEHHYHDTSEGGFGLSGYGIGSGAPHESKYHHWDKNKKSYY